MESLQILTGHIHACFPYAWHTVDAWVTNHSVSIAFLDYFIIKIAQRRVKEIEVASQHLRTTDDKSEK